MVYTDPGVTADVKQQILLKITKCTQTQRRITAKSTLTGKMNPAEAREQLEFEESLRSRDVETLVPSVTSLDRSSIMHLIGGRIESWRDESGGCVLEKPRSYGVLNMLHVGITSLVVELEVEETGERVAGQSLAAPYGNAVSPGALAKWIQNRRMTDSR